MLPLLPGTFLPLYGIALVVAAVVGWALTRRNARRAGFSPSHIDLLLPLLMAGGLGGAWLFGRLTELVTAGAVQGVVLVGALVGGTAVGILYGVLSGLPLGMLGDCAAGPLGIVVAIGRLGCIAAGCCHGKTCAARGFPMAWRFPHGSPAFVAQVAAGSLDPLAAVSRPVYAVQVWEIAGCLVISGLANTAARHGRQGRGVPGEVFLLFGGGYAVLRFTVEFARGDNPPVLAGLTFSQVVCVVLLIAVLITAFARRRYAERWHLAAPSPVPPVD